MILTNRKELNNLVETKLSKLTENKFIIVVTITGLCCHYNFWDIISFQFIITGHYLYWSISSIFHHRFMRLLIHKNKNMNMIVYSYDHLILHNPYDPDDMTTTPWKNLAWGVGDMNILLWENLAVGHSNVNLPLWAFWLKAGLTRKTCHECINLLKGDKTHLVFKKGLLHYFHQ